MNNDRIIGIVEGILESKIEDEIFNQLLAVSDQSLSEDKDLSNRLAGKIYNGKQTSVNNLPPNILKYIGDKVEVYLKKINNNIYRTSGFNLSDAWIVSQYENDYNPLHIHQSVISGIIYLKIPNQISNRDKDYLERVASNTPISTDGKIEFVLHSGPTDSLFYHYGNRKVLITPKEKYMYIFPSWMMHTVYPFSGPGERRTFAFNLKLE